MYCNRCGKKMNTEDRFCSFCGAPVEHAKRLDEFHDVKIAEELEVAYKQVNSLQKDHFDEEWEREERRENVTFRIFGVLIVVLIVAIIGGIFFLSQLDGKKTPLDDVPIGESIKNEFQGSQETVVTPQLLKPNETIVGNSSQENIEKPMNGSENDSAGDKLEKTEFVIYDSDVRYLVAADLNGLTEWQIRVARNEIYARHGRMFDVPELREYFEGKSWYVPEIPAVEFNISCLSNVELENLNFIINYEKAHDLN